MKGINRKKLPFKYHINFTVMNPKIEDILFELVDFLEKENRMDGKFNYWEICNKTFTRINENIDLDIEELIKLGYIEKEKYTQYKVVKHLWE